MKILISTNVQTFRSVLGSDTSHIDFCQHDHELSRKINGGNSPDVWICDGGEVTEDLLNQWLIRGRSSPKTLLVRDTAFIPHLHRLSGDRVYDIQATCKAEGSDSSWVNSTLKVGEKLHSRNVALLSVPARQILSARRTHETVLFVGAGIVNLVTAELLASRGFSVRIVDASPDPRTCKDWTQLGATHGGADARMFTFTEADNYNEMGSDIYHDMGDIFRKTTVNGGWSVKPPSTFSAVEAAWVRSFEQLPAWLARAMKEDIYYVNSEAEKLWNSFMKRAPELFEGVSLHADILRLYAEEVALTAAHNVNRNLGSVMRELPLSQLLQEHTVLETAAKSNELAGGLYVKGFTLGIHLFVNKLIKRIADLKGEFIWNCSVHQIQRNPSGQVESLKSHLGPLHADHFVISTGVTRNGLLNGTASENIVQGVLGIWLQIPNLDPIIKNSIKIHRRGCLVEDINVTVSKDANSGEDILTLGGGYGYVGLDYPSPESAELQALFNELEIVAGTYFPAAYQLAKKRGTLWPSGERKLCIRPFTCTGLGIFEDIPTASGGHLIITGGNNTGGFAQAPAIARAVDRAIADEHDHIHVLFSPYRSQIATRSMELGGSELSTMQPVAML